MVKSQPMHWIGMQCNGNSFMHHCSPSSSLLIILLALCISVNQEVLESFLKGGCRKRRPGTGEGCSALHFCIKLQSKFSFALHFCNELQLQSNALKFPFELHFCIELQMQSNALKFSFALQIILSFSNVKVSVI